MQLSFKILFVSIISLVTIPFVIVNAENEIQTWYDEAEKLFTNQEYQKAFELYDRILQIDENHAGALGGKAATYYHWKDYPNSEKFFDLALALEPDNGFFLSDKGSLMLEWGKLEEALALLKEATHILPKNWDSFQGYSNALHQNGDYVEAIKQREVILEFEPNNVEAMIGIGNSHHSLANQHLKVKENVLAEEEFQKAINSYEDARGIIRNSINAIIGLGNVAVDQGNFRDALNFYDEALEINPDYLNAWKGKHTAHHMLGEDVQRAVAHTKITELNELNKNPVNEEAKKIPSWIKDMFEWFVKNQISEDEMISAIQYLIDEKIIIINSKN